MHSNQPNTRPKRRPAPSGAAAVSPGTGPADLRQMRRLEKTGGWTRRERLRVSWYRLRLTIQEMNARRCS